LVSDQVYKEGSQVCSWVIAIVTSTPGRGVWRCTTTRSCWFSLLQKPPQGSRPSSKPAP